MAVDRRRVNIAFAFSPVCSECACVIESVDDACLYRPLNEAERLMCRKPCRDSFIERQVARQLRRAALSTKAA